MYLSNVGQAKIVKKYMSFLEAKNAPTSTISLSDALSYLHSTTSIPIIHRDVSLQTYCLTMILLQYSLTLELQGWFQEIKSN